MSNNLINFLNSKNEVKLSVEKIELALDFNKIQAGIDKELKIILANDARIQKAAAVFKDAKASVEMYLKVPARMQKDLDTYYKDYAKKAADLDIDVKTTQFFQEYLKASQLAGQAADAIENSKSSLKGL